MSSRAVGNVFVVVAPLVIAACRGAESPVAPEAPPPSEVDPLASAPIAAPDPAAMRAKSLFDHAELLGKPLTVDFYEPLYDADHSSAADPGGYDVEVADVGPKRLEITAGDSPAETAAGALAALPKGLRPPIRVRGVLAESRIGLRVIAHSIERLAFPAPTRIASADVLVKEPSKWAGRYVEVEDVWLLGFEASRLGGSVWLSTYPSVNLRCKPPEPRERSLYPETKSQTIRVSGYAYTAGRYGHLGMARAEIVATEVLFVDKSRPECR